ncbi:hypothetical protein GCM10029978_059530 [Actinoallomurus acanthiterrae]
MSEQLGFMPSSSVAGLPLKLSSANITAGGDRSRDLEPDRLVQLELSISVRALGEIEVVLATTDKSGEGAGNSREIPAAERRELYINSILLSSLPGVLHLSGRSHGGYHDAAAARSYTLTLTFSDGRATTNFWSTTFDAARSSLVDSRWHLAVPLSHSLMRQPSLLTPRDTSWARCDAC